MSVKLKLLSKVQYTYEYHTKTIEYGTVHNTKCHTKTIEYGAVLNMSVMLKLFRKVLYKIRVIQKILRMVQYKI